jgi:ABC-2 type transport system permease protein
MTVDLRNTGVIVQKDFADYFYSPGFRILLGIFIMSLSQNLEF